MGAYEGRAVDLEVSSAGYDTAHVEYNGKWGAFGQIGVKDATTAKLTFSFVDAETSEPTLLQKFHMT